jgi:hypothetical protein
MDTIDQVMLTQNSKRPSQAQSVDMLLIWFESTVDAHSNEKSFFFF